MKPWAKFKSSDWLLSGNTNLTLVLNQEALSENCLTEVWTADHIFQNAVQIALGRIAPDIKSFAIKAFNIYTLLIEIICFVLIWNVSNFSTQVQPASFLGSL